jgi:hypothetical protein
MTVNSLRLSHEFTDLIREGYSQDLFYGDEGEWTKDNRIKVRAWYFWRLDRLCVPRNSELRMKMITKLHDSSSDVHRGATIIFAKALDRFWWRQIRQDVNYCCERCVVCPRANIQPHLAASLVPPKPWHTIGLDYLTDFPLSNGFDNVLTMVDHLTRMDHFLPCIKSVTPKETTNLSLHEVYRLHGLPRVLISDRDPKSPVASGIRFGDA